MLTTPDEDVLLAAELVALDELDKLELVTDGFDELELELLFTELTELLEATNPTLSILNQLTLKPPVTAVRPKL